MKCLIAVNPNGTAWFVSDLFEGSISDFDIFEQWNFTACKSERLLFSG